MKGLVDLGSRVIQRMATCKLMAAPRLQKPKDNRSLPGTSQSGSLWSLCRQISRQVKDDYGVTDCATGIELQLSVDPASLDPAARKQLIAEMAKIVGCDPSVLRVR